MEHTLPALPYSMDALEPYISKETLEYHYGKHHQAYVNNLNKLIQGTELEDADLKTIIQKAPAGGLFNNAAQVFNHTFYWNSMSPNGGGNPTGAVADVLTKSFGSVDEFKAKFTQSAATNFGSGWTWLIRSGDGVEIVNTSNAGTPVAEGKHPLLTCDVWEHAYYIDYRNARPKYLEAFWNLVNWEYVGLQLTD